MFENSIRQPTTAGKIIPKSRTHVPTDGWMLLSVPAIWQAEDQLTTSRSKTKGRSAAAAAVVVVVRVYKQEDNDLRFSPTTQLTQPHSSDPAFGSRAPIPWGRFC